MDLIEWNEKLSRCVKCGSCSSVCPVYLETGQETLTARGKLALISGCLSEFLPLDNQLYDLLSNCLLCGACAEHCPSGVKADDLIQQARSLTFAKVGSARWKRILAKEILPFPGRMKKIRGGQQLLFKKIPGDRGLRLRFFSGSKPWPVLRNPFFLDRDAAFGPNKSKVANPIGFFAGCTINYLHPEVGEAALKLLYPLGKVLLPKEQTCCGLPAFSLGDLNTARNLARRNILAFSESRLDSIVVACTSCAAHLKTAYRDLLAEDTALLPKVKEFVSKIEELSQFLIRQKVVAPPREPLTLQRVAFHDPCHAKRELNIFEEPRKLLRSIKGLSLVELKEQRCCGHGGLFNLSHPDLSLKILTHPLNHLDQSGADMLVTSCMACLMQLKNNASFGERSVPVKHWAELLV
ncbi:MAG: (Fe-S)-binding protein [Thermodesulfobacteriota bacterium]